MEYEEELLKTERRDLCRVHAEKLRTIDTRLLSIEHTLTGNGTPEIGLMWIAKENKKAIGFIVKVSMAILGLVGLNLVARLLPPVLEMLAHGKLN